MGQRTSCCEVATLAEGWSVIVGWSDVSAAEGATLIAALSVGGGSASRATLGTSVGIGVRGKTTDSAKGAGLSVVQAVVVDNGAARLRASCWRSVVNCAR